jgi:hypothetical protein
VAKIFFVGLPHQKSWDRIVKNFNTLFTVKSGIRDGSQPDPGCTDKAVGKHKPSESRFNVTIEQPGSIATKPKMNFQVQE